MKIYIWKHGKSCRLYYRKDLLRGWEVYEDSERKWVRSCNEPKWFNSNVTLVGNNYKPKGFYVTGNKLLS